MPIVRVTKDKKNPYLIMNKTGIDDKRLSLKSKGLLCYLLSKPDNWYITYQNLVSSHTDGIYSVTSAFQELIKFGYIQKTHIRHGNGRFGPYYYLVYEKPQNLIYTKNKLSPKCDFPISDLPISGNHIQLNNINKINNKTTTTNYPKPTESLKSDVDDPLIQNRKIQIIKTLKELKINNYKKIFDLFTLDDIFKYATWIKSNNFKIKNPTGFIISAIREKWIDYLVPDSDSDIPLSYKCLHCNTIIDNTYANLLDHHKLCNAP